MVVSPVNWYVDPAGCHCFDCVHVRTANRRLRSEYFRSIAAPRARTSQLLTSVVRVAPLLYTLSGCAQQRRSLCRMCESGCRYRRDSEGKSVPAKVRVPQFTCDSAASSTESESSSSTGINIGKCGTSWESAVTTLNTRDTVTGATV
jgi:hypothetical protein